EIPGYKGPITPFDEPLLDVVKATKEKVEKETENLELSVALTSIWQLIRRTNKYIDETQPWVLAKNNDEREQLASVMTHLVESLRYVSVFLAPFLTETPKKMWQQLGIIHGELTSWDSLS